MNEQPPTPPPLDEHGADTTNGKAVDREPAEGYDNEAEQRAYEDDEKEEE
jgi:hypothetical protein